MGHLRRVLAILVTLPAAACSSASPPVPGPTSAGHPAPVAAPLRAGGRLALPVSPLTPDQQILHALNRLGYGPRPGDVERVRRIGVAAYVDEQLSPSGLADPAVEQALPAYPVLARSAADLVREYPQPTPQVRQQLASGQMSRQAAAEMYPPERRPAVITAQMQAARVTRAVLSERQLKEVLVDFWFNHFNVYAQKGAVRWMLPAYEREAIRPHVLGRFRDLVLAIARPQQGGGFVFRTAAHDRGEKRVLGQVIPAGGGREDGERVIDILARHPATARFIATKLARRFVSDDPPPALVERAAATFQRTDGSIRAVLVTILTSPEFWSAEAYRAKIKTPLEVVASAVRTLDGRLVAGAAGQDGLGDGGMVLAREVARLGEPLYEAQPPTGYPDRAESWVNTGALLGRMNFALGLAHNRLRGTRVDLAGAVGGADRGQPAQVLDRLLAAVLHGEASPATRAVLAAELESPEITRVTAYDRVAKDTDVEKLAALVLGSPEFQRRLI